MVSGAGYDYVAACARIARDHYPERCERVVIVNAPKWFSFLYAIVTPLINQRTQVSEGASERDRAR